MSGLDAARYGLSVVSQNIENADTDGYSRQGVQQAAVVTAPSSGLYTTRTSLPDLNGVTVTATTRSDDPVLDARVRDEHSRGAAADTTASALSSLEGVLGEPSDTGLASQLGAFWSAWGTVANSPDSTPARTVLLQSAQAVTSTLHSLSDSFTGIASSTSASLDADLTQANSAAQQLATLNGQIAVASALHNNANDLLDKRDALLDSLGKLVGGVATIGANGAATVTVGGQTLVSGVTATSMTQDAAHQVSVGGSAVTLSGGSAGARVTLLTNTIPGYQSQLDSVANTLAAQGNSFQSSGYDLSGAAGAALFSGTGAAGLTVAHHRHRRRSPRRRRPAATWTEATRCAPRRQAGRPRAPTRPSSRWSARWARRARSPRSSRAHRPPSSRTSTRCTRRSTASTTTRRSATC